MLNAMWFSILFRVTKQIQDSVEFRVDRKSGSLVAYEHLTRSGKVAISNSISSAHSYGISTEPGDNLGGTTDCKFHLSSQER